MFCATLLQTLVIHQHWDIVFRLGMRIRSSIIAAVYSKVRFISSSFPPFFIILSPSPPSHPSLPPSLPPSLSILPPSLPRNPPSLSSLPPSLPPSSLPPSLPPSQALRMTSKARQNRTVGEIVNLMSVDAQRLMDLMTYLYAVYSAPLQIVIALVLLYRFLGPSIFAGFAVMIILIPVNFLIAGKGRKYQVRSSGRARARIGWG